MTRYYIDTEFMEDGERIELLSIGVVCEDGRELYFEDADANFDHANEWVRENVLPLLDRPQGGRQRVVSREAIAAELFAFVNAGASAPEFWGYYCDYDWVVICQLYGRMVDLPSGWPMFCMDLKQLAVSKGNPRLPSQASGSHNALADARWIRDTHRWLIKRQSLTIG